MVFGEVQQELQGSKSISGFRCNDGESATGTFSAQDGPDRVISDVDLPVEQYFRKIVGFKNIGFKFSSLE